MKINISILIFFFFFFFLDKNCTKMGGALYTWYDNCWALWRSTLAVRAREVLGVAKGRRGNSTAPEAAVQVEPSAAKSYNYKLLSSLTPQYTHA